MHTKQARRQLGMDGIDLKAGWRQALDLPGCFPVEGVTAPAGSVAVLNASLWQAGTTNRSGAGRRIAS